MNSNFQYNSQTTLVSSIEITDICNCALEAIDQLGNYHYLIIITNEGETTVITFGPVIPDLPDLPNGYTSSYNYYKGYTDSKIQQLIRKWVLGGKKTNFETINQIEVADAISQCRLATDPIRFC